MMPGFSGFLLVFLTFLLGSLTNKRFRSISIFSVVFILLLIFEMIDLYIGLGGTEVMLILLGTISAYFWLSYIAENYRGYENVTTREVPNNNQTPSVDSSDYTILQYALNVVCFSVFACNVVNITTHTRYSFTWLLASGVFQTITGVVALRRKDAYQSNYIILHGLFWLAIGSSLLVGNILQKDECFHIPVGSAITVLFFILFVTDLKIQIFRSIYNIIFALFVVSLCVDGSEGKIVGIVGWIGMIISIYGFAASIGKAVESPIKLPLGNNLFQEIKIRKILTCLERNDTKNANTNIESRW